MKDEPETDSPSSFNRQPSTLPYWRSIEERSQSPEVLARLAHEFPERDMTGSGGVPRRDFLRMMTLALAAAGLSLGGCRRWPEQEVRPQTSRPEGHIPGVAKYYATMYELGGVAHGVLAKSYEGRPIKIEGNPLHPYSLGAADAFAQASILELYDPDRGRHPIERSAPGVEPAGRRWEDFDRFASGHFGRVRAENGKGLAILARPSSSPTLARLRGDLLKAFPRASWHSWEPLHRDQEIAGARRAFGGKALRSQYHLEKVTIIACFDADLLGSHPAHQKHARDWATGRGDGGRTNRLYMAESAFSITGSVADERLAVRPSVMEGLLRAVADIVRGQTGRDHGLDARAAEWAAHLARDLKANPGTSVIAVGPNQPADVHALAHALNIELRAAGQTVTYTTEPLGDEPGCIESITQLTREIKAGRVTTLLILDGNPFYDAPADIGFDPAAPGLASIHLSAYDNETSARCRWQIPQAHYLECWGDGRAWDGTYGVQQPLILPLFDGRSPIELVAMILGLKESGPDLVRQTAKSIGGSWDRTLHDGVLQASAWPAVVWEGQTAGDQGPGTRATTRPAGVEAVFAPAIGVHDGRFAENGWLQEMPDPLTKVTWDNPALIARADADARGITTGDIVRIESAGRSIEIPAYIMPGLAAGAIVLPLGYGRTHGGHIARGVGVNVYPLRTAAASWTAPATIAPTGRKALLAMTQDHHLIDAVGMWGREQRVGEKGKSGYLIREGVMHKDEGGRKKDEHAEASSSSLPSHQLFDPPSAFNSPHAWGMAIDLNRCIGCSACVVACQVENNVPIVGKDQVANNREMHWLRIDRYFRGPVDDPDVVYAPMACAHCENAPCEQVCPVAATVHDSEGLNTMVYNRCVGTRYCSNNCPYKVRRFNYFDYHSSDPRSTPKPWLGIPDEQQTTQIDAIKKLIFNPDVTVRMRGVMEKCTYCTQRLQAAKINAKVRHARGERMNERVDDGEAVVACQQACPTQAIIFGDLNDTHGKVARAHHDARAYAMLDELNLRTRTRYMAKLRNPAQTADDKATR